jgi:hypothetical protein
MNNANLDQSLTDLNQIIKDLADAAHRPVAQEITQFLEFRAKKGTDNYGKGVIWSGQGYTKQFVYNSHPDRFFSSESIDLDNKKTFSIGGVPVLSEIELGNTVTKSSLQSVGRLRGLIVDGSVSINQYLFYNAACDRLGLGTEAPNAGFSVAEMGIEVMLGTTGNMQGMVGTFASTDFNIVTDNTPRITVSASGNIQLGNLNRNPVQVSINGKLAVGVTNPDPAVDLHVAGSIRFGNRLHSYASEPPREGNHNVSDIIWNTNPTVGRNVGWICLRAGNPGSWYPFGEIKERG